MSITFAERPASRRSTTNPPTFETEWECAGVFDSGTVAASAKLLIPPEVFVDEGILYRQNLQVREAGFELYYISVTYGQEKQENGEYSFKFSTMGGTVHISHSRETVAKYPDPGAPDHGQAIAVNKENRPDGTDIVIPALRMSYTFKHPAGVVNEAMAVALARVTGTVNESTWHGFEGGEVLFLGADGSDGTDADAEVTYHVAAEENLSGLIIDAIADIEKDGHDFLWVWWQDDVDDGQGVCRARAVYVERLYRRVNFTSALGF